MRKGRREIVAPRIIFDPTLCPLLQGLSPEEQEERIQSDPIIRACVSKVEGGGDQTKACGALRAYSARRKRATSAG